MAKVFDLIAPVYNLFYGWQYRNFGRSLDEVFDDLKLGEYRTLIDLGSGTGSLTAVFRDRGFQVTGVDLSIEMVRIASGRKENRGIDFAHADASSWLPFPDKSFDVAFTSFVAHGMAPSERMELYREMQRLAKHLVIIRDYNTNRNAIITLVEWAERGDYFNFIRVVEAELKEVFGPIRKLKASAWSSWYVCDPR